VDQYKKRRLALMAVAVVLVLMSVGISYQLWETLHGPEKTQATGEDPLVTRYREDLQACRGSLVACGRKLQLARKHLARVGPAGRTTAFQPVTVIKDQELSPDKVVNSQDGRFAVSYQAWDQKQQRAILVITPNADEKPIRRPLARTESHKFQVDRRRYSLLVTAAGPKSVTISVTRYQ
jgi:hypothetical protein